jgi:hypothetical protein
MQKAIHTLVARPSMVAKGKVANGRLDPRKRLACALAVALAFLVYRGAGFATTATVTAQSLPTTTPTDAPTSTLQLLRESGGILTPAVSANYVKWARGNVLASLSSVRDDVPADVLREIDTSPALAEALFASVYPPDPSILHNYVELRSKLGLAFLQKYRSLVVASAVAHRKMGVLDHEESDEDPPDPEDLEVATTQPEAETASNADVPDEFTGAIAEFMKTTNSAAKDIYDQKAKQQRLTDYLKAKQCQAKLIARLEKPKALGVALKAAMIQLGQRPAKRQSAPELVPWLKHLAEVYESKPSIPKASGGDPTRWPLFPMDQAPWPLLMPLSRPLQLDEANYIYEKFEGKHGPDRYHTYGPYRKWEAQLRAELEPSEWHWGAWPSRVDHGGVCVVMAGIAIDTHRALCQPAVPAGQPHHSNLISYHYDDGKWSAHIDQAFAGGPPVTHALWMFKDVIEGPARLVKKSHAGAEYHLGIAAAMDVGIRSYMDSRIAVHLYNALPVAEKQTIGAKLLTHATKLNPFNPEPWYLLADQTTSAMQGLALSRSIVARVPDADLSRIGKDKAKGKHGKGDNPSILEIAQREYWGTVAKFVIHSSIERHGMPADKKEATAVNDFLQQVGLAPS